MKAFYWSAPYQTKFAIICFTVHYKCVSRKNGARGVILCLMKIIIHRSVAELAFSFGSGSWPSIITQATFSAYCSGRRRLSNFVGLLVSLKKNHYTCLICLATCPIMVANDTNWQNLLVWLWIWENGFCF